MMSFSKFSMLIVAPTLAEGFRMTNNNKAEMEKVPTNKDIMKLKQMETQMKERRKEIKEEHNKKVAEMEKDMRKEIEEHKKKVAEMEKNMRKKIEDIDEIEEKIKKSKEALEKKMNEVEDKQENQQNVVLKNNTEQDVQQKCRNAMRDANYKKWKKDMWNCCCNCTERRETCIACSFKCRESICEGQTLFILSIAVILCGAAIYYSTYVSDLPMHQDSSTTLLVVFTVLFFAIAFACCCVNFFRD